MSELLEHILNSDYVSANRSINETLNDIREQKLYEVKRQIQAEAFGGLTKAEIEDRKKRGYKKASDVLPDPRDIKIKPMIKVKKKKISEQELDEAGLAPTAIGKLYRAGLKMGGALGSLYGKMKPLPGQKTKSPFPSSMHDALKADQEDDEKSPKTSLLKTIDTKAGDIASRFGTSAI